jgi:hypothetical protein
MNIAISGGDLIGFRVIDPVIQMFTGLPNVPHVVPYKKLDNASVPTIGPMVSVEMAPAAPWNIKLSNNVDRLRKLSRGWDGPYSLPINNSLLNRVTALIRESLACLGSNARAPFVVPLPNGGVQVEWHVARGELEFELAADGKASIWIRDHGTNDEFETEGAKALNQFMLWAARLAAEQPNDANVPTSQEPSIFAVAA